MAADLSVKNQRTSIPDDEHRVLQFRPRDAARHAHLQLQQPPAPAADLSRYERRREEPDEFRHRMLANAAAFCFTIVLTAVGIWLATSIADLRRNQDCVLMGRRDCAHISTPRG